jgi:hypothetical protein
MSSLGLTRTTKTIKNKLFEKAKEEFEKNEKIMLQVSESLQQVPRPDAAARQRAGPCVSDEDEEVPERHLLQQR